MGRIRTGFTRMANAALRPLGAEVVRAGLVSEKAATINALLDQLAVAQGALPPSVAQALALSAAELPTLTAAPARLAPLVEQADRPAPADLFTLNGQRLPCWPAGDETLYDGFLLHPRNYPFYFALFQQLSAERGPLRLLEIGVRTGYIGAVFAQAAGPAHYVGLDPNQYVANGLDLAAETLRRLRAARPAFSYALWEGYSWQLSLQRSLAHGGPYDLVHIDGDHSLAGKLLDLDLARRLVTPTGLVLVDDFDHHPPVADAIRRALALGWYRQCTVIATLRGLALLEL